MFRTDKTDKNWQKLASQLSWVESRRALWSGL